MTPGKKLSVLLKRRYKSQSEAARALDISAQYLSDVVSDRRPFSAELAVRVTDLFGYGEGETILRVQMTLDLEAARVNVRKAAAKKAAKA